MTARFAPTIELRGVARTFGSVTALADVDLTVDAGSYLAVMGGNGAGKTTLLRTVAGLALPTAGTVRIAGVDRRRAGPAIRAMIGYVGHDSMLYADLTVRENLAFAASLYGVPERAVEPAAARFGVGDALDRRARALSRGNRQRVALARALLHDPPVLLLDEPFTGLDIDSHEHLAALLCAVHGRGHTILLTAHDAAEASDADRLVVLAGGRIAVDEPMTGASRVAEAVRTAQRADAPPPLPATREGP